jgi:hypothetical protein
MSNTEIKIPPTCLPLGWKLLVAFFAFGALACTITTLALLFPGGCLDPVWRLNPEARAGFPRLGTFWAVLLMIAVGTACLASAVGLYRRRLWGWRLAIALLAVNLIGDFANAVLRHDPRTLIGLPIGGALIVYLLWSGRVAIRH